MTESNQSSNENEVWRTRLRHKAALRAGMSNAEATAYANDPNSPALPSAHVQSSTATASNGNAVTQLNSDCSAERVPLSARLSPEPTLSLSADNTRRDELDADRLMTKNSGLPESPDGTRPSDSAPDYAVGYGRPPVDGKFKKGHPKLGGRRKGQRNRRTIIDQTLNEKVTVREGSRSRSMSKFEALILTMTNEAVSGNAKARANIITLARSLDLIGGPIEATDTEPLTPDDPALLADFLGRYADQAEFTRSPGNTERPETGKPQSKEIKKQKP